MTSPRKCTATKHLLASLMLLALCCMVSASWAAQVVGTIAQLSGPLLAKKADGAVRVLSLRSEFESGDTLVTEKNTYALLKFIDNSEITLKPSTTFKVENFAFDAGKPEGDQAAFSLVKGSLRSVTGTLGKRNKEKFSMKTPSATIGIRGTTFIADLVLPAPPSPASLPTISRAPGLYVEVLDGMISVANTGGALNFSAGQFGYTPSITVPPVVLPANPGIQFSPPPVFNSTVTSAADSGTQNPTAVDCVVR